MLIQNSIYLVIIKNIVQNPHFSSVSILVPSFKSLRFQFCFLEYELILFVALPFNFLLKLWWSFQIQPNLQRSYHAQFFFRQFHLSLSFPKFFFWLFLFPNLSPSFWHTSPHIFFTPVSWNDSLNCILNLSFSFLKITASY